MPASESAFGATVPAERCRAKAGYEGCSSAWAHQAVQLCKRCARASNAAASTFDGTPRARPLCDRARMCHWEGEGLRQEFGCAWQTARCDSERAFDHTAHIQLVFQGTVKQYSE